MRIRIAIQLALLGALAGCAGGPAEKSPDPFPGDARVRPVVEAPYPGTESTGQILLAELALQRNQVRESVGLYVDAADAAGDPGTARRATVLAWSAGFHRLGLHAVARWEALAPGDIEPVRYRVLLNLEAGGPDDLREAMADFLDRRPADAGVGALISLVRSSSESDRALNALDPLLDRFRLDPEERRMLGTLALDAGQAGRAVALADGVLADRPGYRPALALKGRALEALGRLDDSLAVFDRAIAEAAPEDRTALRVSKASVLMMTGENARADELFEAVLEEAPDHVGALYASGVLALEGGNLERARQRFVELLQSGVRRQTAYYYLGRIAEDRGKKKEALTWYRRVQGGDRLVSAQRRMARILWDLAEPGAALDYLARVRESSPGVATDLVLVEARLLEDKGRIGEAFDLLDQAIGERPGHVDLIYERALMAERQGRLDEALADFRDLAEARPDDPDMVNALGYTLADRTDRLTEARALIERALALAPDRISVVDSMGWVLFRQGHVEEAISYLDRAWELSGDPEIAAHLGEALWKKGEAGRARHVWNEALEAFPDHPKLNATVERYGE